MRLFLIRHGQSTWNAEGRLQGWGDPPLSEQGRAQAYALARRLGREKDIALLYTSPLLRARQTAEIIAGQLGVRLIEDDRLKERDVGSFTGLTEADIMNLYPEFHRQWHKSMERSDWPGENYEDFASRVRAVMADIIAAHSADEAVGVISHGGVFGVYLSHLVGWDYARKRSPFRFSNASLTIVSLNEAVYYIALLNDTCHLEDEEYD